MITMYRTYICVFVYLGSFQAQPALLYDSVYVFAAALTALDRSHSLKFVNLSCDIEKPWNDGLSLYNYLNSVSWSNLFDRDTFL
jgi:glutamate receptor, ionotropic, invertebrate